MTIRTLSSATLLVAVMASAPRLTAQDSAARAAAATKAAKPAKPFKLSEFWKSTVPFELTLTVNLKRLKDDKMDLAPWEAATVTYTEGAASVTHPARVRTRGISRLKICNFFPPIWIDFNSKDTKSHVFDNLNRFKLVSPCKFPSAFERYAIEEYNLYRLHALMTPVSHLTRMIHLTVVDSASKKPEFTRYAFAVEDADALAARLGGKKFAEEGAKASDMQQYQTAMIGMLQYMIGNTDFSIYALHNAELVQLPDGVYPIAYDFDQAGVIAPPYAVPDARLEIRSVKERIYRGLCVSPDTVTRILTELREKRAAINALYTDDIGKLISNNGAKESISWFDDFYKDMSNPKTVKSEVLDKCRDVR